MPINWTFDSEQKKIRFRKLGKQYKFWVGVYIPGKNAPIALIESRSPISW